jgi:hypothetical protein
MTTTERYWVHSDPEPPQGPVSAEPAFTATPLQNCLNGCERATGDVREPIPCQPGHVLCSGKGSCTARLEKWLRGIPDSYALLPSVVDHGTVPSDPGTKHTKRPDPPAPGRLEVMDLLDTRRGAQFDDDGRPIVGDNRRGVFGAILAWSGRVRLDRNLPRTCDCGHLPVLHHWAPPLASLCRADCRCTTWKVTATLSSECGFLVQHLAWCTQQDWAGDLYQEIRVLARSIDDTVGEYRPKPVGSCAALRDVPGSTVQVLCGGALVMEKESRSVKCLRCDQRHEASEGLRALGLIVGAMFGENQTNLEASA